MIRDAKGRFVYGHKPLGGMNGKKHTIETRKLLSEVSVINNALGICGYKKGHRFYGDLSKSNYFHKGIIPWNSGTGHKCSQCGKRISNKTSSMCRDCWKKSPKTAWNKGKKYPKETLIKLSNSHKGQKAWNKGTGKGRVYFYYPSKFSKDWFREEIKKRDNYKCQMCGITEEEHIIVFGKSLCLHHIDYKKENCSVDNLVTICRRCHARTNYNRSYWISYFNKLLNAEIKPFSYR
jgi:hypothetical protein